MTANYCPDCGEDLSAHAGADYCPGCGEQISTSSGSPSSNEELKDEEVEAFQNLVEHYGTDDMVGAISEVVLESVGAEVPEPDEN